ESLRGWGPQLAHNACSLLFPAVRTSCAPRKLTPLAPRTSTTALHQAGLVVTRTTARMLTGSVIVIPGNKPALRLYGSDTSLKKSAADVLLFLFPALVKCSKGPKGTPAGSLPSTPEVFRAAAPGR